MTKIDFSANIKKMDAIETKYQGYFFRSRLEARWAVFFEELDCKWTYEVQGFRLRKGDAAGYHTYLPDFYIEDIGTPWEDSTAIWIEIKGVMKKKSKEQCRLLAIESECPVLLIQGDPMDSEIMLYRKHTPTQEVSLSASRNGFNIVKVNTNESKALSNAKQKARSERFGT